jgi:putative tryptophan/tyrosine transport system substrate-binding protein
MNRRDLIKVIGGSVIARPLCAWARQSRRGQVGVLDVVPEQTSVGFPALRKKLAELGYVEGRNIAFEYRWSDEPPRLPALAAELVGSKMDIIVTGDTNAALVAKKATKDIPIIVAVFTHDPVAEHLVGSLRRPGGNVTGISSLAPEMSGKRLELLREIVPGLTRVAMLWSGPVLMHDFALIRESYLTMRALGIAVETFEGSEDIEDTFQQIIRAHDEAIDVIPSVQFSRIKTKLAELGLKYRLPIITGLDGFAQLGGLINYGPSLVDNWRQAAVYVDKILKGEKAADLPVLQPTKFELAINLKTAKAIGLAVPPMLLTVADEVIE